MPPNMHLEAPKSGAGEVVDMDVVHMPSKQQPSTSPSSATSTPPLSPPRYKPTDTMHAHPGRKRDILAAHPEIRELFGYEWRTKWLTAAIVAVNLVIAAYIGQHWRELPWWALFAVMYLIGTPINHACAMVIHECSHDLTAATTAGNRAVAFMANLPLAVPSAASFIRHHAEHHSYLGVLGRDLDLAPLAELEFVGRSNLRKAIWKSLYMFSYGLRPVGWHIEKMATKWEVINVVFQIGVDIAFGYAFGPASVVYMFVCTLFSFGAHPVAAHFIQEHYTLKVGPHNAAGDQQETFSYYGRLNPIILNVGYHNEHHDLCKIPWTRLPEVRRLAPEFYENLQYHTSVWDIITDFQRRAELGPDSRVCRTIEQYRAAVKRFVSSKRTQQPIKQD